MSIPAFAMAGPSLERVPGIREILEFYIKGLSLASPILYSGTR